MKTRFRAASCVVVLVFAMQAFPAGAQNKIEAFLDSDGRTVFTNVVENTPAAPVQVPATFEMPASLGTLIDTISANHGVDPALVRAVIKTESNFNRWAVS